MRPPASLQRATSSGSSSSSLKSQRSGRAFSLQPQQSRPYSHPDIDPLLLGKRSTSLVDEDAVLLDVVHVDDEQEEEEQETPEAKARKKPRAKLLKVLDSLPVQTLVVLLILVDR